MTMHEHLSCQHDLKHCAQCDTVYCELCKEEWHKQIHLPPLSPTPSWPRIPLYQQDPTYIVTCHSHSSHA